MAESGAHLVDNVLPKAPHWSTRGPVGGVIPLAATHAVCGAAPVAQSLWLRRVLGVVTRALSGALLKRAGVRHCEGARTAMVPFI